jgi:hypothetical protein
MVSLSSRAVLACTLLCLAACELPDNDARPPDPPVYLQPVVQSTTPPNQAINVPTSIMPFAKFSQVLDAKTVTTATFTLSSAAGPVTGTVYLSAEGKDPVFTPSTPLAANVVYTATLDESIRNSTGQNLSGDYAWTFTTGVPSGDWEWGAPALLETSPNEVPLNYAGPEVAIDDAENACAVWIQYDGSVWRVYASRSVAGGPWQAPIAINGVASAMTPQVAFEGSGQVLVTWSEGLTLWFSRAGMTGAWQSPQQFAMSPTWSAVLLRLLADAAGNALLFYYHAQQGAQSDNMYVVRLDTDSGWEAPIALPVRHAVWPSFAMDPSGYAAIAWSNVGAILARRYLPSSGWTANEIVETADPARPNTGPVVTMDGAGTCLAVWLKRIAGGSIYDQEIYSSRATASQAWPAGALGPATAGQWVTALTPALSPDGAVALTWVNQLGWRCWASLWSPAGAWNSPVAIDMNTPNHTVSSGTPFFAGNGRIAVLGHEGIYIPGNEHSALWITEYNPGSGWAAPSRYRTGAGYMNNTRLAMDSAGRAAAVWMESEAPAFTGINSVLWGRFR